MRKFGTTRLTRVSAVDGIPTTVTEPASGSTTPNGTEISSTSTFKAPKGKQFKVLRKIPPEVFAEAKGLAIFTSMRSGIAPFGGAGGTGVVVARLPDGCKSS
jgi:lipid-binding SYLF domain-containing protein